jgi:hypothetical protein
VDPRAGLEDAEKKKFLTLPGLELRTFGPPARSQSLYRLRYHGRIEYKERKTDTYSEGKSKCVWRYCEKPW